MPYYLLDNWQRDFGGSEKRNAGVPGIVEQMCKPQCCHILSPERAQSSPRALGWGVALPKRQSFVRYGYYPYARIGFCFADMYALFADVNILNFK